MNNPFEALELRLSSIEFLLQKALSEINKKTEEPDTITVKEAAAMLHLSVSRLYTAKENYPHKKVYGKLLFSRKDLLEFIDSKRYKTKEERFEERKRK